jgi:hypothetical protein
MAFVLNRQSPERIPNPPPDPRTIVPTRVKALKGFWWYGRNVQPGEQVTITRWSADDLVARGRAEYVDV